MGKWVKIRFETAPLCNRPLSMRTLHWCSSESAISQLLEILFPILSERTSTSLVFTKSTFLAFLGSIRARVGHRVFRLLAVSHSGKRPDPLLAHNTWSCYPPWDPSTFSSCAEVLSHIASTFVGFCPFLSDWSGYPVGSSSTHAENH